MSQSRASRDAEQRRKEFEEWMSSWGNTYQLDKYKSETMAGCYKDHSVELAWLAWQAAILRLKKTMCNRN